MTASPLSDKSVFNAAREIESEDARREYLQRICGDDQDRFDRVAALLQGFEKDSQFLESPVVELLKTSAEPISPTLTSSALASPTLEQPGAQIGPYIIREQLGEGGMGVVYVAEQQEPVRRHVALKIIKPGMDSKEVLARFDAERQALATMSHPNIAKILDGGTTQAGRPFFVMELVKGVSITKFCDNQKLNLRERLELFVTVCQAVQHAHLKGIIHRDLKPSNILVELHDVTATPKVIDFGVAKAIHHRLTQNTIYTRFSQMIGTPQYMSPEQAQLSGMDIDTRSDVYSLGVVMYELLTGSTPFGKSLAAAGYDEMRRIIQEDEPPRPSCRISTLKAEAPSTLAERQSTGTRQWQQVERELDWIVMKALEKDRDRRYESASAMAQDIRRYLNDEPVEAFPPSATYRLRKFASRHMTMIVTTGLVAAALLIGTTVSIWQAHEANDARQLADQRFSEADKQRQNAVRAAQQAQRNEEFSQQLVYAADIKLAALAWQTGDVSRFTSLLDRHSPVADKIDRRGFEWRYLQQFGTTNFCNIATQTGGSCVVRYSPDGKYLVTGRTDGTVCFWDGQSHKVLSIQRGHEGLVRGIDFASDGNRMASIGDDGMIRLWDLAEQKQIRSFQAHDNHGFRVFFVLDGELLASCGEDSSVKLWNASTGEALDELEGYATNWKATRQQSKWPRWIVRPMADCVRPPIHSLAFSPDGLTLASGGGEGTIAFSHVATGQFLFDTKVGNRRVCGLQFSPDGATLAAAVNFEGVVLLYAPRIDSNNL